MTWTNNTTFEQTILFLFSLSVFALKFSRLWHVVWTQTLICVLWGGKDFSVQYNFHVRGTTVQDLVSVFVQITIMSL